MNIKLFMASLIPALIFCDVIMWDSIKWLRFLTVYWQVVSWVVFFIILHYWNKNQQNDAICVLDAEVKE